MDMVVKVFTHTEAKAFLQLASELNNVSLALVKMHATDRSLKNYLDLHSLTISKGIYFADENGKPALESEIDIIDPRARAELKAVSDAWIEKRTYDKRLFHYIKTKLKKHMVFIKVTYQFVPVSK